MSIVNNNSKLPSVLTKKTVEFSAYDILKIIRNLNPNKAHGHDMINIRMLKICDESICKPLGIIFWSCLQNGKFPSEWKKANVVPIFKKKNNKQEVKNYSLISLLPVSSKVFERLLYGSMFKFFTENSLISQNQSGFKPGDSCTNQHLSITHQIYKSFDDGHEVGFVFLDMSKAFDKVWHKGLIFKLKQNGISGNLLSTLSDFLKLRKQRVMLNDQLSSWFNIESGVPQGSILDPLLFLIYTNVRLFADYVSLFSVVDNIIPTNNRKRLFFLIK